MSPMLSFHRIRLEILGFTCADCAVELRLQLKSWADDILMGATRQLVFIILR